MAESLKEIFDRMLGKQAFFVERYHALQQKYVAAEKTNEELKAVIEDQQKAIEKLRTENEYLHIVHTVAPDEESRKKVRQIVAKLVRDVDKCIRQLEE